MRYFKVEYLLDDEPMSDILTSWGLDAGYSKWAFRRRLALKHEVQYLSIEILNVTKIK